ncbi:phosphate ABC transporter ATP-binding protein PstB [Leptolyngbya sp. 15MV]|nr:phosphate ABC transporter ATP-binding protein PstB [Leptolyngbya sp. 15MV]
MPYHELLHRYHTRRRAVRLRAARAMDTFLDIAPGDYVVHAEHGIARFLGLGAIKAPRRRAPAEGEQVPAPLREARRTQEPEEYLTLEFAGGSKLHVPALQIDQVQRYVGGFKGKPQLSTLGGQRWKAQKQRVADSVRDLAAEMLRVRAAREHMPGIRYPGDTAWMREFEAEFPYEETEDQLAAIAEIKRDMESPRPMDRLICGDVGFGKTELAIRAAFKAAEFGKQVAVLVPTTVLAEQHERTLRSRLSGYPFRIESLSRFKSDAQQRQIIRDAAKGQIDILVGTHRILSDDVRFADLGLVVIDEEQRFGVEHKERLLRLRLTVDVLTLSATPIPRTLHMSMLGLRDISSLTTAPLDRRAIVTEVIPFNERRVQQAIARELAREGQVYVVHNRISDIFSFADSIQKLAPGARVVVGHGQMDPHTLEDVMLRFMRRDADILVSTTIIESGIDIPTANTIIINDADRFGLADLHQLRGRVGRSKHRAYCYLMLPNDRPLKETARKRLKAIEQYSMLGAGFKIAMRDLEIRGAGNLLGAEQSGHIAAVGYEMYCRLLDQTVRELKGERPHPTISATGIDIGITSRPHTPAIHPAIAAEDPVLNVRDFSLYYGGSKALHHISMDVPRGKVTALIGPSGCGKSTLLRAVNRMNDLIAGVRVTGQMVLNGQPIYSPDVDVIDLRKRMGMVFQKPNPFPMSVFDNVIYPLRIDGENRRSTLEEACERSLRAAALWDEVKDRLRDSALGLSGGQQQRLCIARAIVADPEVLLMDEPCSALDPIATLRIEELIHQVSQRYTVLIVTHNMQQAARVSDYTAFLYLGRLVEFGPTAEVFQRPHLPETEQYVTGRFG